MGRMDTLMDFDLDPARRHLDGEDLGALPLNGCRNRSFGAAFREEEDTAASTRAADLRAHGSGAAGNSHQAVDQWRRYTGRVLTPVCPLFTKQTGRLVPVPVFQC